jgi:hypothetical protein
VEIDNLNMTTMRMALSRIYFGEEESRYVIPLKGDWVLPTADPEEKVSTWIGYQIAVIKAIATSSSAGNVLSVPCHFTVRLWAMGRQAEQFITDTLFWDKRLDIHTEFGKLNAKLIHAPRIIKSQVYSQEGFNSELLWLTDIVLQSGFCLDMAAPAIDRIGIKALDKNPGMPHNFIGDPSAWFADNK